MIESSEKKSNRGGARPGAGRPPGRKPEPRVDAVTIDSTIERITQQLKDMGAYSRGLDIAISAAAGAYIAYHKCIRSIQKRQTVQYSVLTREGSKAYKIYPDVEALPALTRSLKDMLKALGLTLDTLDVTDDDPLATLMRKVDSLDNG